VKGLLLNTIGMIMLIALSSIPAMVIVWAVGVNVFTRGIHWLIIVILTYVFLRLGSKFAVHMWEK